MGEPKGPASPGLRSGEGATREGEASRGAGGERENRVPIIEVRDLIVHHGQLRALDRISLRVFPGEVYAIIGANGAGKSTLLRTIAGLHRPTEGSIRYDGQDVTRIPPHRPPPSATALLPAR